MNTQKLKTTSIIASIAIATIALAFGLSETQTTTAQTAPQGNSVYVFGEGVNPKATFAFRDSTVTYDFQLYDITTNLFSASVAGSNFASAKQVAPEFTLARIVGDTPYLHEAVDQTYQWGGRGAMQDYPYKYFDVTVKLDQAGQSTRTIQYKDCSISNYKVNTRTDNEEGYTSGGKAGFAVVETYSFICNGFTPIAEDFNKMKSTIDNPYKPYGQ